MFIENPTFCIQNHKFNFVTNFCTKFFPSWVNIILEDQNFKCNTNIL